jgi:integrase
VKIRRAPGTGSVRHRGGDRYQIRLVTSAGTSHSTTVRAESAEAANAKLDALVKVLEARGHAAVGGITLRGWAGEWLARREAAHDRSIETYRSRVENHILTAPFADDLLANIRPPDVRSWLRGLLAKLSATTAGPVLSLLRQMMREAVEDEILDTNPAGEVRVPRAELRKVKARRAPLAKADLDALLAGPFPLVERALIAVAALAGLRSGEAHAMPLGHVERRDGLLVLHVEFGGFGGAPTKSGEARRVPVLGPALAIVEEWLAAMPQGGKKNPERLLFPGPDGGRRDFGHATEWLQVRCRAVGLACTPRFHDLRHTAATALENGWYGPPMVREHVQAVLGHATIQQTEEYSGGAGEAMLRAAAAFALDGRRMAEASGHESAEAGADARSEHSRRRRPCSPESVEIPQGYADFGHLRAMTEALILAVVERRSTAQDVYEWADAVLACEPEFWQRVRALREDRSRFVTRRALDLAREMFPGVGVRERAGGTP